MEFKYQQSMLPDHSEFLTSIFNKLSVVTAACLPCPILSEEESASNPLASLPPETLAKVKPLLLTLHCLFPNEFLLALDILDRKLVRNYNLANSCPGAESLTHGAWFVISSSSSSFTSSISQIPPATASTPQHQEDALEESSNSGTRLPERYYEVHIDSWNCTCPAFTLASVQSLETTETEQPNESSDTPFLAHSPKGTRDTWRFGGKLTTGIAGDQSHRAESPLSAFAICKHLLACTLVSQCPTLFGHGLQLIAVSESELAALYAT